MTVSNQNSSVQYIGNASTTVFGVSAGGSAIPFFANTDLVVTLFDTTANQAISPPPALNGAGTYDYTVTGASVDSATGELTGASITFNNAPLANHRITIQRVLAPTQSLALIDNSKFPAESINAALDRETMLTQQAEAAIALSIQIPASDPSGLNTITPPQGIRANTVLGFDPLGNVAVYTPGSAVTNAANVNFTLPYAGAVTRSVNSKLTDMPSIVDFGADPTGVVAVDTAFAAAITALEANSKPFNYLRIPAGTYKFAAVITLDISKVCLIGDGATLDFSAVTSGSAITMIGTNTGDGPYPNMRSVLSGLVLVGNSSAGSVIGLNWQSTYDVSHCAMRDVGIKNFAVAERFGDNAYLIHHSHVNIWECGKGLSAPSGTSNSGENISFSQCALFNMVGLTMDIENTNADFNFSECSIDYSNTTTNAMTRCVGSEIHFNGCHLEGNAQQLLDWGGGSSGLVDFISCTMIQASSSGSTPYLEITSGNYVRMIGGRIIPNASTTTPIQLDSGGILYFDGTIPQYSGSLVNNSGTGQLTFFPAFNGAASLPGTLNSSGFTSGYFISNLPVKALTTAFSNLGIGPVYGLLIARDESAGGVSTVRLDAGSGVAVIDGAGITGLALQFSAGDWQAKVSSGATTRNISIGVFGITHHP